MIDLAKRVAQASESYAPCGGADWGFVYDSETEQQMTPELRSYNNAWRAASVMNAREVIKVVLDDLQSNFPANVSLGEAAAVYRRKLDRDWIL